MARLSGVERPDDSGLRERKTKTVEEPVKQPVEGADGAAAAAQAKKKTIGRTPDGTAFTVPHTRDMVSQLLSPSEPKNLSDILVLSIIGLHIVLLYLLPSFLRIPIFAVLFLSWRAAYNIGIGWLLHMQSNHSTMVLWARQTKIFVNPATGDNPHPQLYSFIKRELETKIPEDYSFEDAPIEYNTWLVFRRVVDLILMCDFTSYCLFAIACGSRPAEENFLVLILRWVVGLGLVLFNLWVKLDAHRVVKDFAWYWGDFFYLVDQELTFDGVFEMAPHPMYSVGYAGYYGISLMAASYKVLFISILAHAAQFAFLVLVENPHIEKTYNAPPPRKRTIESHAGLAGEEKSSRRPSESSEMVPPPSPVALPSSTHNLVGVKNLDLHRITDSSIILIQVLFFALTMLTPSTPIYQFFFVLNAAIWRLWYSVGIGYILNCQSHRREWTRHFVKFGETKEEAWNQWKGTYHLSMTLCYASFIAAAWKMYTLPENWGYGLAILKHVLGAGLIALQIWTSVSIYDSLGEFGWFFGDFFFDEAPKLTYSGIYRFLNNPERVLGLAGVWGAALITSSRAMIFLALLSHTLGIAFIQLVERPHMQKLYGRGLRQDAGLVRSIKRSLPPSFKQLHGSVDRILDESIEFIEEVLDTARPKLAAGVTTFVKDTSELFHKYPARITITRIEPDLAGYDMNDYSINVDTSDCITIRDGAEDKSEVLVFEYGSPIKVNWTAPLNHSKRDWVGLYMIGQNPSREVTNVSSWGRWVATNHGSFDSVLSEKGLIASDVVVSKPGTSNTSKKPSAKSSSGKKSSTSSSSHEVASGQMVFSGDKLWWTQGVFEFRYHHNGKHNVMATSRPFEIRIPKFDDGQIPSHVSSNGNGFMTTAIEQALLPIVQNCFDRDPEISPQTAEEPFGCETEGDLKYAKRVVYAVHQMFGIEFATEVVRADGNVQNLAWRICNAKKVLAPYSMRKSNGASTPTGESEEMK